MKKRIGLCLSGCGMNDGSEIHESVITILALDSLNVDIVYMAPNITQKIVNNHLINNNSNEIRNVLTESARISITSMTGSFPSLASPFTLPGI